MGLGITGTAVNRPGFRHFFQLAMQKNPRESEAFPRQHFSSRWLLAIGPPIASLAEQGDFGANEAAHTTASRHRLNTCR